LNLELMRFLLIICTAVMVYWQYFIINLLFQEANFSPLMKSVVRTYTCAISLDHSDFRLFMFCPHSYSKSGGIHCQFLFETEVHLPIFQGSCSNLELLRILWIIWIAVTVYWQYFIRKILFQKANFSPTYEDSC